MFLMQLLRLPLVCHEEQGRKTEQTKLHDADGSAEAQAAVLLVQALIFALLGRGLLAADEVVGALEDVTEAQRSAAGDPAFSNRVLGSRQRSHRAYPQTGAACSRRPSQEPCA